MKCLICGNVANRTYKGLVLCEGHREDMILRENDFIKENNYKIAKEGYFFETTIGRWIERVTNFYLETYH